MELINQYNIMFALANNTAILLIIFFIPPLSKLITLPATIKPKNLVVEMSSLAIDNHITTNNTLTI